MLKISDLGDEQRASDYQEALLSLSSLSEWLCCRYHHIRRHHCCDDHHVDRHVAICLCAELQEAVNMQRSRADRQVERRSAGPG